MGLVEFPAYLPGYAFISVPSALWTGREEKMEARSGLACPPVQRQMLGSYFLGVEQFAVQSCRLADVIWQGRSPKFLLPGELGQGMEESTHWGQKDEDDRSTAHT